MIKVLKNQIFVLLIAFICPLSIGAALPRSEAAEKEAREEQPKPIVINSRTMEMDNNLMFVTFLGDVKAVRQDFVIDCDKMLAYYEKVPERPDNSGQTPTIKKIIAKGNVIINRAEGGVATSETATYLQNEGKMILTGDPTLKRGADVVKGNKITIFLDEDRVLVEGSEDKDVTVIISPPPEKN